MTTRTLRQHKLFWTYIRSDGKCSVCGEEVSPEEATLADATTPHVSDLSDLKRARLTHVKCQPRVVPQHDHLRAA